MPISAMILRELERSRQIIRGGDVLVPRFIISTPDGEFSVLADLPTDAKKHEEHLAKIYAFMIWRQASAFVMSCEWQEPNAVCSIGVSRPTVEGMMQAISRGPPVEFGPLIKLESEQIGDELPALLPRRSATLSAEIIAELEQIFGPGGELEAVRLS
jgi:hypothetical protein